MAASEELGILGVDSWHYFVRNPERSRTFYERGLGWREVARASDSLVEATGQRSRVYQSGEVRVVVSTPENDKCRAARYLRRHPAGVGSVTFAVEDIERTWRFLAERGGTPIHEIAETRDRDGRFRHFSITTAIGDVAFRFVERTDYAGFAPGFEAIEAPASYAPPAFGFKKVDHITNNAPTMAPVKLWFEHVLGFEQCWEIEFHTNDGNQRAKKSGTGLKSVVMWDPRSGLKFPINEPLQPFFKEGQINSFVEDNAGAGVQHIALEVEDCVGAVKTLRDQKVGFLRTPGSYYDAAPARLATKGVDAAKLAHRLDELRDLGILIDGRPENLYLIQIFLQDAATLYAEPGAGPFFYELIQRCGDPGFGEGNFRALFEAIERDQVSA
jgi:4-hydroxyphenylpyruvate dioxygenase